MKILANAGWDSQITAISRIEFLTSKQHKHCMHKFIDQTMAKYIKMQVSFAINIILPAFNTLYKYHLKDTQDATFVGSSIEDHGPEHVDDNTPKTFWESAATKNFRSG